MIGVTKFMEVDIVPETFNWVRGGLAIITTICLQIFFHLLPENDVM